MDLYNDMVENVVKPTIDAFMVETKFMKKLNIEYRAKDRKRDIYEDSLLARLYRDGII